MIKVGIIGATGYAGVELVRLLKNHPEVELAALSSVSFEGSALSHIYPGLREICDNILVSSVDVVETFDVVVAALPHGLSPFSYTHLKFVPGIRKL